MALTSAQLHALTVRALCQLDHDGARCQFPECICGATRHRYEQQSNAVLAALLPAITRQLFELTSERRPRREPEAEAEK